MFRKSLPAKNREQARLNGFYPQLSDGWLKRSPYSREKSNSTKRLKRLKINDKIYSLTFLICKVGITEYHIGLLVTNEVIALNNT